MCTSIGALAMAEENPPEVWAKVEVGMQIDCSVKTEAVMSERSEGRARLKENFGSGLVGAQD
jgi:hypothetical protein